MRDCIAHNNCKLRSRSGRDMQRNFRISLQPLDILPPRSSLRNQGSRTRKNIHLSSQGMIGSYKQHPADTSWHSLRIAGFVKSNVSHNRTIAPP